LNKPPVRACAVGAALFVIASLAQAGTMYRLVDLGAGYTAYQVNQQGLVAGSANNVQPAIRKGSQWHDILYGDGNGAYAIGVDAHGNAVAGYTDIDTSRYVLLGYRDGSSANVEPPFKTNVNYPVGISSDGAVIAFAYDQSVVKCYAWKAGTAKVIPTPGDSCNPSGINARHQVTGGTNTVAGGSFQAFLWDRGALQLLGTFGGTDAWGMGINAQGHVAIKVQTPDSTYAGIYEDGQFVNLGSLPAGLGTWPVSINDTDQVVGSWYKLDADGHAVYQTFLYTGGQIVDLASLVTLPDGWTLTDPRNGGGPQSINDQGVIVGNGMLNGQSHAYMLVPTAR